jgi:tRNA(Ile2) C34 agmatinyltransferase TiaS
MDKLCICGTQVEAHNGGFSCPRCLRQYNTKGKQININNTLEMLDEKCQNMDKYDINTLHWQEEEK